MAAARRWRGLLIALAVVVVVLVALRVAAPTLATRYLNRALADLGAYRGHVEDVDLAILRGAATVHDLTVEKKDSPIEAPLAQVPRSEVSIQWNALLQGELVGEVIVHEPRVHFVHQAEDVQYGEGVDWQKKLEELAPVRVNRIAVRDGRVHFQNPGSEPPVDVHLSKLAVTIENLTNIRDIDKPAHTSLRASAVAMNHAPLSVEAQLDPLQEQPQFDLNFEMLDLRLPQLNPLLKEYVNVTAEDGTFSVSGEVAAAEGAYTGYVKPLLDNVELLSPDDFTERPLGAIWESMVAAVADLIENPPKDRIGTRVPIEGEFAPEPDIWSAIKGVFRNMFDAFLQGVEGTVDLRDAVEEAREP